MKTADQSYLDGFEFARKFGNHELTAREILAMDPEANDVSFANGMIDHANNDWSTFERLIK